MGHHPPGKRMSRTIPLSVVFHWDPPLIPQLNNIIRVFKQGSDSGMAPRSSELSQLGQHTLFDEKFHVRTVDLRDITPKMVITRPSGAAVSGGPFFSDDDFCTE